MARFDVTVTDRDLAPVDASAATKCKCKCDSGSPVSPPERTDRAPQVPEAGSRARARDVELSPLADER